MTLTFPDGERIAAIAREVGLAVEPTAINRATSLVRREMASFSWAATAQQREKTARGAGAAFFRRLLELATPRAASVDLDQAADAVWTGHLKANTWCRVGEGVHDSLTRLRAAGLRLAVVSNSEGTLGQMLADVGLRSHFDAVFDSWVVGVAKPDPRIFEMALQRLDVAPSEALMIGDTPTMDIDGAREAGVAGVLIDPLNLHPNSPAPRYPDFATFTNAFLSTKQHLPTNR